MIVTLPDGRRGEVLFAQRTVIGIPVDAAVATLNDHSGFYAYATKRLRRNQEPYKTWRKLFRHLLLKYARHRKAMK